MRWRFARDELTLLQVPASMTGDAIDFAALMDWGERFLRPVEEAEVRVGRFWADEGEDPLDLVGVATDRVHTANKVVITKSGQALAKAYMSAVDAQRRFFALATPKKNRSVSVSPPLRRPSFNLVAGQAHR